MKKEKHYGLYKIFSAISAVSFWMMLAGCSEQSGANADPYPEMPTELRALQGSWVDINTNDSVECTAIFQGFTVRVRYQATPEVATQKQNASIDQLDTASNLLLINGGTGAWPYEYSANSGTETLRLEFFASDGWHKLNLCRAD